MKERERERDRERSLIYYDNDVKLILSIFGHSRKHISKQQICANSYNRSLAVKKVLVLNIFFFFFFFFFFFLTFLHNSVFQRIFIFEECT